MVSSRPLRHACLPGLILALAVTLAVGGCASQGSGPRTTSESTPAGVPAGAIIVSMKNIAFVPADVTIKVGQTVAWVNEDSVQHDVVANDGTFKSALLDKNQVFAFTFTKAGSFAYYCAIHPQMTGTVTVQP